MRCPKCHAPMHTYNRNGVQIERCSGCRGTFLVVGELEPLTRLEAQWAGPAPPPRPLFSSRAHEEAPGRGAGGFGVWTILGLNQ
ncbi:zf-TFIIB domain-containing protein [Streptomyces sp. TP-A0356]|uniref:TFIIB-type zinc ribbon-containing protein n=1 Tax=Streptomyces sp. TP-A0356 TaxID=1359208 RepID=UPI00099ED159